MTSGTTFKDGFGRPGRGRHIDEHYEAEVIARFGETLAPLIDRFGYEGIESIGLLVGKITQDDAPAALELLEQSPAIVEALMKQGEQLVLQVYGLGNQIAPYGSRLAVTFMVVSPRIMEKGDFDTLARVAGLAAETARTDAHAARALLEQSPGLIDAIGVAGLERVARYGIALARSSWMQAVKEIEKSLSRSEALVREGGLPFAHAVYDLASKIAEINWTHAVDLIEKSPAIARSLSAFGDAAYIADVYEQAGRAVHFGSKLPLALLEETPAILDRIGKEACDALWESAFVIASGAPDEAAALIQQSPHLIDRLRPHMSITRVIRIYGLGNDLAAQGATIARQFVAQCAALADRLSFDDMKGLQAVTARIGSQSIAAAETFLERAPDLIDRVDMEDMEKVADLAIEVSRISGETASRLLTQSPAIIERLGLEGLITIGRFSALLSRESWTSAVHLLEKCPAVVDGLLALGGGPLITRVCDLGERIADYNARLAVSLIDRSPHIIGKIGFAGLEKLEDLAHSIGKESWTTAVSLIEESSAIIERVGFEGLEAIAAVARRISRDNNYGAVSLIEKSPDLIDRLCTFGNATQALRVYAFAEKAASSSWRTAATLLEKSPQLLSLIGYEGLEKLSLLITEVAERNKKISTRILDLSPAIIHKIGYEGLEAVCGLVTSLSREEWTTAMSVIEKSPDLIEKLASFGDRDIPKQTFQLAAAAAVTSRPVALRLLEKSYELINLAGIEGFGKIAAHVVTVAGEDEEKALSFLRADSIEFTDFMEHIPRGLELKEVRPVLATYLRALLGRRVEIAEADTVSTDGIKIFLPRRIKEFQENEHNFTSYKVLATHQEAHLEYGSFEFDYRRIGDCAAAVTARYGNREETDGSDIERFFSLFPEPDLAADLFNMVEDFRIEARLKGEYPALGEEIARMNRHRLTRRSSLKKMTNQKQRAVEMVGRTLSAGSTFDDREDPAFTAWTEAVETAKILARPEIDVHDSASVAAEIYGIIDEAFDEPYHPVRPLSKPIDQNSVTQNIGSFGKASQRIEDRLQGSGQSPRRAGQQKPVEAESAPGKDTTPTDSRPQGQQIKEASHRTGESQRTYESASPGGKQESGDADDTREKTGSDGGSMKYDSTDKIERLLRAAYRERGITPKEIERRLETLHANEVYLFLHNLEASLKKKTELESERGTTLYAEWGDDINEYRANWSRIREQLHKSTVLDFYRDTVDRHAGLLKKIRREFQMLKPEGFSRLKRQYDGDEIDLDAVVEYLVDRKVGLSPSEKNYTLIRKKRRDIAVAFLIDMSRSTKGSTIDKEKESLIIMSEALHEVGDAFAVYGFSGDNRDNVDFYLIKDFDEPYKDRVKKRICAIEDRFENRDGTAIRHTINKLRRRAERTKMIILLSDGKPVDKEYAGAYAIEDTRMALKEAQRFGIKTFCITVDKSAADYLPRMYSHSSWTVIDDVVKLPEKITRIYRMLTT